MLLHKINLSSAAGALAMHNDKLSDNARNNVYCLFLIMKCSLTNPDIFDCRVKLQFVAFHIFCSYFFICKLWRVKLPRLGKRELIFLLYITRNYVVSVRSGVLFLLGLGYAVLFYCGTPWAFHIIIMLSLKKIRESDVFCFYVRFLLY